MNYYNNNIPYYGNQYMSPYMAQYQQQRQYPQQQVQQGQHDTSIQGIKFLTADEIKAYIVMPNTSEILVDKANSVAHIKSADAIGQSSTKMFKYEEISELPSNNTQGVDTKKFLTQEDIKDFLKRDDLKTIDDKLDYLEKQIKINRILKGEDTDGQ